MNSVSFGSMFNPERVGNKKAFNPEHNIEGLKNDAERPKDFPTFPSDSIGRSQVKQSQIRPHKLELTNEDREVLTKLSSYAYGFHGDSNEFWSNYKKPTQGAPKIVLGDGKLDSETTRHDFAKNLVDNNAQAFQVAGNDVYGGFKIITVVKNNNTGVTTMYTCDSKQCYPVAVGGNEVDLHKLASVATDSLSTIHDATVWTE